MTKNTDTFRERFLGRKKSAPPEDVPVGAERVYVPFVHGLTKEKYTAKGLYYPETNEFVVHPDSYKVFESASWDVEGSFQPDVTLRTAEDAQKAEKAVRKRLVFRHVRTGSLQYANGFYLPDLNVFLVDFEHWNIVPNYGTKKGYTIEGYGNPHVLFSKEETDKITEPEEGVSEYMQLFNFYSIQMHRCRDVYGLYNKDTNTLVIEDKDSWILEGNWRALGDVQPNLVSQSHLNTEGTNMTEKVTTGNPFDVPDYGITTYPRTFGFNSKNDLTVRQVHGIYHKDTHTFVVDPQDYWVFDGGKFAGSTPPKVIPQSHYIEADVEGYTNKILQGATQGATPSDLLRRWSETYATEEDGLEALCLIIEEYGNAPLSPSVEYALRRTLILK